MAFERISIDPARMTGLPCIRGTRITVSAVLGQIGAGQSLEHILEDYPQLEREDVAAALQYAAASSREHEIALPAAGRSCSLTRTSHNDRSTESRRP